MKAAILIENKKPLLIGDLQLPEKLEVGQVLVKILYSGICGAQINEIDAVKGEDNFLPHLLGHEGSGIVEKIGPGVTTVKEGDHVAITNVGAYGMSMSSNYNTRPTIAEIMIAGSKVKLIRKRQNLYNLIKN